VGVVLLRLARLPSVVQPLAIRPAVGLRPCLEVMLTAAVKYMQQTAKWLSAPQPTATVELPMLERPSVGWQPAAADPVDRSVAGSTVERQVVEQPFVG